MDQDNFELFDESLDFDDQTEVVIEESVEETANISNRKGYQS